MLPCSHSHVSALGGEATAGTACVQLRVEVGGNRVGVELRLGQTSRHAREELVDAGCTPPVLLLNPRSYHTSMPAAHRPTQYTPKHQSSQPTLTVGVHGVESGDVVAHSLRNQSVCTPAPPLVQVPPYTYNHTTLHIATEAVQLPNPAGRPPLPRPHLTFTVVGE